MVVSTGLIVLQTISISIENQAFNCNFKSLVVTIETKRSVIVLVKKNNFTSVAILFNCYQIFYGVVKAIFYCSVYSLERGFNGLLSFDFFLVINSIIIFVCRYIIMPINN